MPRTEEANVRTALLAFTGTTVFVCDFSFSLSFYELILFRKQNRGMASAAFDDDLHAVSGVRSVATEKAEALLQAELVFLAVVLRVLPNPR
jgi:hypothetical protein